MSQSDAAKLGAAFGLVCLAGLCAPLGACVVLFLKKTHTHLLASSIALAAGVMIFVSLTEVLGDSSSQIQQGGWSSPIIHTYTYLAFFCGVVLCRGLDWFTDALMKLVSRTSSKLSTSSSDADIARSSSTDAAPTLTTGTTHHPPKKGSPEAAVIEVELLGSCSPMAAPTAAAAAGAPQPHTLVDVPMDTVILDAAEHLVDDSCAHLVRTSMLVWLALSLHNLPEGLATFVGYMSSPHLGITVAVAIAIHNIPEGIALGVPLYFATGSKLKAIGWTAVSGMAEPLGALIGLAVQLGGRLDPVAMGIIMAVVAGIMTGIAIQELLPRALSFDPDNRFTTHGVFAGMAIMAVSLVLLSIWDRAT